MLDRLGCTMAAYGRRYQIIVVDDASTDGTAAVAEAARAFLPVRLVRHAQNGGLGRALRTGLLAALPDSEIVVTMDADNSHDPEIIPLMAERLEMGSRSSGRVAVQEGGEVGSRAPAADSHGEHAVAEAPRNGVRDYSSVQRLPRRALGALSRSRRGGDGGGASFERHDEVLLQGGMARG